MKPDAAAPSATPEDPWKGAARPVTIPPARLTGDLTEPEHARAFVLLAYETRDDALRADSRREAAWLAACGLACLSVDLLHEREASDLAQSADIDLLSKRILDAVRWAQQHPRLGQLRIGLMATGVAVAAALRAAAVEPQSVRAIVSRHGRPDLAGSGSEGGRAAVLLLVSGEETKLLGQNAAALGGFRGPRRMEVIDGVNSLFQDRDAPGSVMELSREWFRQHLVDSISPELCGERPAAPDAAVDPALSGGATRPLQPNRREVREAVGVFDTVDALQAAIDELLSSGFDRADLSLLASLHAVEEKLGDTWFHRVELEDNPAAPRGDYVSPDAIGTAEGGLISGLTYLGAVATAGVIALAGGPLTAIVVGAAVAGGAGGLVGARLAASVGHHRARYFQQQLDRGGLLLWVRTSSPAREVRATDILARHSGRDVHVHGVPAGPAGDA